MEILIENKEYQNIVEDILKNEEYQKLKDCKHHGLTRIEHCIKVSYYSYLVSKYLKLNYQSTARAGLLHDFFLTKNNNLKEQVKSFFIHPYKSLKNSESKFKLTDLEKDIIATHMFPVLPHKIPKYLESWIISIVDKLVATQEFMHTYYSKILIEIPSKAVLTIFLISSLGL